MKAPQTVRDRCASCGFRLWWPIKELQRSVVGLYDDARFPGRCIVMLDLHEVDFAKLPESRMAPFMGDVQAVGRAIKSVTGSDRINYAILGNVEPHIHVHVIPRGLHKEDKLDRPPWEFEGAASSLGEEARVKLIGSLRGALDA